MFQRTIRKIAISGGVDQKLLSFMYPPWMKAVCYLSILPRLVAVILLFCLNWKIGVVFVIEYVISFIVQGVIPKNDDKNLRIILKRVKSSKCDIPDDLREALIEDVENWLEASRMTREF